MQPKPIRAVEHLIFIMALAAMVALNACSSASEDPSAVLLPGEDDVLATVNGSKISAYDLAQAVRTSLGQADQGMLDEKGRKSVLESLVAARAISQVQAQDLSAAEKAALSKQVAAHREQLLVKMYLARHTEKEPVSRQMVADYYNRHGDQFGAKTVKQYELIASQGAMADPLRDQVLAALQKADRQKDWAAWSKKLSQKGLPMVYKSGNADPAILTADLRRRIADLEPGQPASLAFADGVISLARVTAQKEIPPRPLDQVSARIRKMLLPVQLKKAVRQAADQVLKQARVEYTPEKANAAKAKDAEG